MGCRQPLKDLHGLQSVPEGTAWAVRAASVTVMVTGTKVRAATFSIMLSCAVSMSRAIRPVDTLQVNFQDMEQLY